MSLVRDSRASVPKDLAQALGPQGLRKLLSLLADAYRDLYAKRWVQADSPEDSITEEWFIHIQARWRKQPSVSLIPVHQKQDRTKAGPRGHPPTIDFCFRDGLAPQAYFGAECKLLDEGSRAHLHAYLDGRQGIGRFLSGKYAAHAGAGAMVGYIRRGESPAVADKLAQAMQQQIGSPKLKKSSPLPEFDQLYESTHTRTFGISPFLCFHLLFAFHCSAA